ncbi:MAG: hypothetical protein WAK01_00260 [Methylocystis sp.]
MRFSLVRRSLAATLTCSLIATAAIAQSVDVSVPQSSSRRKLALVVGGEQSDLAPEKAPLLQRAQLGLSVTPNTVDAGATATLTISAPGTFDLSVVKESQIGVRPGDDVINLKILEQSAQHLKISFDLADTAPQAIRTLFINNDAGATVVALDLNVNVPGNICVPPCTAPNVCSNNTCVNGGGGGGGTGGNNDSCGGRACFLGEKCCKGQGPDGVDKCEPEGFTCQHF